MISPPTNPNIIFDTSVMDKIQDPGQRDLVGVLHKVNLSRAGSLTCPVAAGVVFVGKVDWGGLEGKTAEEVMEILQQATQGKTFVYFCFRVF